MKAKSLLPEHLLSWQRLRFHVYTILVSQLYRYPGYPPILPD